MDLDESEIEIQLDSEQSVSPRQDAEESQWVQLISNIMQNEDAKLRIRSFFNLLGAIYGVAKIETLKVINRLNLKIHLMRTFELAKVPINTAITMMNTNKYHKAVLEYYEYDAYATVKTAPVENCPTLVSLHELRSDCRENAIWRQWQVAPLDLTRRKFKPSKFYTVQHRAKSRTQMYSACSSARLSPIDLNDEDDFDECDRFSLGSSTAGASTVNPEDRTRINQLEAQLAQLQSQMNQLLHVRSTEPKPSLPDQLPSLQSSVQHSPVERSPKRCAPPPPPPPPPLPPNFLRPKPLINLQNQNSMAVANSAKGNAGSLEKETAVPKPRMIDVLKGLENVKLRKVDRSPNGTPMRGNIQSWPTSRGKKKPADGSENENPFSNDEINDNSFNNGPMDIGTILRKKFRNVRLSDSYNDTDNDEDDGVWDEDLGTSSIHV